MEQCLEEENKIVITNKIYYNEGEEYMLNRQRIKNVDTAYIPRKKIGNYLLNPEHRDNQGKAKLLNSIGYTLKNKSKLKRDILKGIKNNKAEFQCNTKQGEKYKVEIELGLTKKIIFISIWIVDGKDTRFVTIKPKQRGGK